MDADFLLFFLKESLDVDAWTNYNTGNKMITLSHEFIKDLNTWYAAQPDGD